MATQNDGMAREAVRKSRKERFKMKTSIFAVAFAAALAGCTSVKTDSNVLYNTKDPVIGNWGLRLPYDSMSAGHAIFTRDAKGKPQALVLWRWASPTRGWTRTATCTPASRPTTTTARPSA